MQRWRLPAARDIHLGIDDYLDPFVPPNAVHRLPRLIARFLGYRREPAPPIGDILVSSWAMLGAFAGLIIVTAVLRFSGVAIYNPPVIFASLGATAILNYNSITAPLAQPRPAFFGHTLSAVIGVGIAKLFMLRSDFESLRWIAGPVACGVASFAMGMTNTVHPPGGATALLAVTDPTVAKMGWIFVPLIMMGVALMFPVALLVNNAQRTYPVFWWSMGEVGAFWRRSRVDDAEAVPDKSMLDDELSTEHSQSAEGSERGDEQRVVVVTAEGVLLPDGLDLDESHRRVLKDLSLQLASLGGLGIQHARKSDRSPRRGSENSANV